MLPLARTTRHQEIEAAAYELLAQKGYGGASMLSIAKAAKASNETMYRWYGDKNGLFAAMVEANAAAVIERLQAAETQTAAPRAALATIAPILLGMILSDRAILLNRAAAGDPSGALGAAIAQGGRATVAPLIGGLMARGIEYGQIKAPSEEAATELFLTLLIGDQQIRRVIGVMPQPGPDQIAARVAQALAAFDQLTAP